MNSYRLTVDSSLLMFLSISSGLLTVMYLWTHIIPARLIRWQYRGSCHRPLMVQRSMEFATLNAVCVLGQCSMYTEDVDCQLGFSIWNYAKTGIIMKSSLILMICILISYLCAWSLCLMFFL